VESDEFLQLLSLDELSIESFLENLTKKLLFFLMLATGGRISETRVLRRGEQFIRFHSDGYMSLTSDPAFLAKN